MSVRASGRNVRRHDEEFTGLRRDRPWIHVTEGTIHVQAPLVLKAAASGLANLPMEVIMTTGGNREPAEVDIGDIASNVHLYRWVSHH